MDCQPVSTACFGKGNYSQLTQRRYRYGISECYQQLYDELNVLHRQAFWDGAASIFNGGLVRDINFSRLRQLFSAQRSRINELSSVERHSAAMRKAFDSIYNAFKKVGDTLEFIMGGNRKGTK